MGQLHAHERAAPSGQIVIQQVPTDRIVCNDLAEPSDQAVGQTDAIAPVIGPAACQTFDTELSPSREQREVSPEPSPITLGVGVVAPVDSNALAEPSIREKRQPPVPDAIGKAQLAETEMRSEQQAMTVV